MDMLSQSELKDLLEEREDACVSIYMPTHRVGPEVQQDPIRFKNLLTEAENTLLEAGMPTPDAQELLDKAHKLRENRDFWEHQEDGLAMFITPEELLYYRLPLRFEELSVVSDRFHIKPLLPLFNSSGMFYILGLSQGGVRLFQGTPYSISEMDLEDVPKNIEEALEHELSEKQLQHQTLSRTGGGSPAIYHGHAGKERADKDRILRFFHKLDKGLEELLNGEFAPMVLAGVQYLFPLYKDASSYPLIMDEGILGNPEQLSAEELHERAWKIVEPYFQTEQQESFETYYDLANTNKASNHIGAIVPAAHHGRVDTLFVAVGVQWWGTYDPDKNLVRLNKSIGPESRDLADFSAVHTILNGGRVFALDAEEMPANTPMAAIFRY